MSLVAEMPVFNGEAELAQGLARLRLDLPPHRQAALLRYVDLLQKWNRVYNLTAIREPERMLGHHLLDSLGVLPHLRGKALLDVGTGAGLPGIPLAIARPDLAVTMLDSNQKKTAFVQQAISELGLKNAKVVCARVEQWQPAERFDAIVSRAFADLSDFVTQSQHLLAPGGALLAMKGVLPKEEMAHLPAGYQVKSVERFDIPGLDAERHLVIVEAA